MHEMAALKRWKFAARSEKLSHEQQSLLDETIDSDLAVIEPELERHSTEPKIKDASNNRAGLRLPANLPRVNVHHEPESTSAAVAGSSSASAGMSARSSITGRAGSPSGVMFVENGCSLTAKP